METTTTNEQLTREFNYLRNLYAGEELTREEISLRFKNIPYGTSHKFIEALLHFGILYQNRTQGLRRYYVLENKPIYKEKVANLISYLRSVHNVKEGKKNPIEEAIKLLKSHGYVIFKPV